MHFNLISWENLKVSTKTYSLSFRDLYTLSGEDSVQRNVKWGSGHKDREAHIAAVAVGKKRSMALAGNISHLS